jgi:hypothetical protein
MSPLHQHLDSARGDYRSATYPGDLADELLPKAVASVPSRSWRYLLLPLVTGAIAAALTFALWPRHNPVPPATPQIVINAKPPAIDLSPWPRGVSHLQQVAYNVVTPVRSGMHQAVTQIGVDMQNALGAPVVVQSVTTVKHVAGELEEFATVTWSQLTPRKQNPGC